MGTILLYGMDVFRENAVARVAEGMKIRVRRVSPDEADIPILKILESDPPAVVTGLNDTIPEMIYMAFESPKMLDEFLEGLRQVSIRVALKAMATPTNINWTIRQLAEELTLEHRKMTGKGA